MTRKHKLWALMPSLPKELMVATVRQYEDAGLEGVWSPQLYGSPFVPLAAAAAVSERLKLGTGVALAFVRSPLETASSALELDMISGGRCVLGIGPSIKLWNEEWDGVRYGKPLAHLREVIAAVRLIIAKGHSGELGRIDGEYVRLNLERFKLLAPPVRPEIPIYIPAVFEKTCEMAGEIADGLPGPQGVKLLRKRTDKVHPLESPAPQCTQDSGHARLSCASCHTAWAPRCNACHTQFDPKDEGFDHAAQKWVKGTWNETAGPFEPTLPTLGVLHDGDARGAIDTFVPGMIMTFDRNKEEGKPPDIVFRRLYAKLHSHTTRGEGARPSRATPIP